MFKYGFLYDIGHLTIQITCFFTVLVQQKSSLIGKIYLKNTRKNLIRNLEKKNPLKSQFKKIKHLGHKSLFAPHVTQTVIHFFVISEKFNGKTAYKSNLNKT